MSTFSMTGGCDNSSGALSASLSRQLLRFQFREPVQHYLNFPALDWRRRSAEDDQQALAIPRHVVITHGPSPTYSDSLAAHPSRSAEREPRVGHDAELEKVGTEGADHEFAPVG